MGGAGSSRGDGSVVGGVGAGCAGGYEEAGRGRRGRLHGGQVGRSQAAQEPPPGHRRPPLALNASAAPRRVLNSASSPCRRRQCRHPRPHCRLGAGSPSGRVCPRRAAGHFWALPPAHYLPARCTRTRSASRGPSRTMRMPRGGADGVLQMRTEGCVGIASVLQQGGRERFASPFLRPKIGVTRAGRAGGRDGRRPAIRAFRPSAGRLPQLGRQRRQLQGPIPPFWARLQGVRARSCRRPRSRSCSGPP